MARNGKKKKEYSPRRANNTGSTYTREDGTGCCQISCGVDENGHALRPAFYGANESEAFSKALPLLLVVQQHGKAKTRKEFDEMLVEAGCRDKNFFFSFGSEEDSFQTLYWEWLFLFKRSEVHSNTFERYVRRAKLHLFPAFGIYSPAQITKQIIQKQLCFWLDNGMALSSVKKHRDDLRQFFDYLVEDPNYKSISHNPVNMTKVLKKECLDLNVHDRKTKALRKETCEKIIQVLPNHLFLQTLILTLLLTGLRIGEALALKWKDFDCQNGCIYVEHGITVIVSMDNQGNILERRTTISDTKTIGSVRAFEIPEVLCMQLLVWKQHRLFTGRRKSIDLISDDMLIFGNDDGSLRTYYGTRSIFSRFIKKHHIDEMETENITFHRFRHTFATMLAEKNLSIDILQQIMGHTKSETTKIYINSPVKRFLSATEKINSIYQELSNTKKTS